MIVFALVTWIVIPTYPYVIAQILKNIGDGISTIPETPISQTSPTVTPEIINPDLTIPLNFNVVDAEYNLIFDQIIVVSNNPDQLHIYGPVTKDDTFINLPFPPTSVSVSPNGYFAAVGHKGHISYIDLRKEKVKKVFSVDFEVFDVVLTDNGWIYSSAPWTSMNDNIHALEIATGTQTARNVGNSAVYKLHPDGQRLYGANLNRYPTHLITVGISEGVPNNFYDFQYHGGYEACQNLWLSENGERIFTGCGNIFRASPTPSQDSASRKNDMIYEDSLNRGSLCVSFPKCSGSVLVSTCYTEMRQGGFIQHLFHSAAAKRVLLIAAPEACTIDKTYLTSSEEKKLLPDTEHFTEKGNQVAIFNYETLEIEKMITLPDFIVDGLIFDKQYPARGRFVFVNSSGTQYYVIVQAAEEAELTSDFWLIINSF
jgi:chitinase